MSEKVLGFLGKDATGFTFLSPSGGKAVYSISEDKLVPVRLKSESVSVEWLEETVEELKRLNVEAVYRGLCKGKDKRVIDLMKEMGIANLELLLSWAKKEAGKR